MASQKPAKSGNGSSPQGQRTLFGFFQKVSGPSPATPASAATSKINPKQKTSTQLEESAVKPTIASTSRPVPLAAAPPSPPSSIASGSSSPKAPALAATKGGGPSATSRLGTAKPNANLSNPFKSPLKASAVASSGAGAGKKGVAYDPRSGQPTPPNSSPVTYEEQDYEDEDDFVPAQKRRAVVKKRQNYFESGSESDGGSDFEADSDASPPRQAHKARQPLSKRQRSLSSDSEAMSPPPVRQRKAASSSARQAAAPRPSLAASKPSQSRASPRDESPKAGPKETIFPWWNDRQDVDGNRPGEDNFDERTLLIPRDAWQTMTPFERQYFKIKQHNMDTILMFQKGKFYEMFLEDAEIVHRELDLKLADRGRMPMAGVPEASFEMFATKLLALGYKVGRVDQMETAVAKGMRNNEGKKSGGDDIVRRELRHVMTSATMIDGLEDDQATFCMALTERITTENEITFGLCLLDAATSDFKTAEWTDDRARSQLETVLRSMRIREVIHKKGGLSKESIRTVRNCLGLDCRVTMLREGKEWLSEQEAQEELLRLFAGVEIPEAVKATFDQAEALSACGGMFGYLQQLSLFADVVSSRNFGALSARQSSEPMRLDANTLSHLCILQNEDGSDVGTLHRLLNRCITPSGKRLFKTWLTNPPCNAIAIQDRLDAVDDMIANPDFEEAFSKLKQFPDFDRLMPKVYSGKIKPFEFTGLLTAFKRLMPQIRNLTSVSADFQSCLVRILLASVPDVAALAGQLDATFVAEEDGSFTPTRGVDEGFDAGQTLVEEVHESLDDELKKCRKQVGLGSQKNGGCNWKHKGTNEIYQVEVPRKTAVPRDWQEISATQACKAYYPPRVRALVQELKEARETRLAALKAFHSRLFEMFNANSKEYTKAIKAVAELDCLLSLAKTSYAMGEPTCRPKFVECDTAMVSFEDLRHPCIAGTTDFIANDVRMGGDEAEVILLTGGNMAGKSTTARTVATAVILAQLGCRVPAKSATLCPVDRISTRMGANDQIFRNSSTFMVEMQEASRIIKDCTPRSLVIMDELGRGTSTFDGHAIAHAVLHHLIARTRCLCFFLTHYLQLACDFQGYPRCVNKHMEVLVDDERREVVFTYKLVDGVAESSYGTQVAALAGVPHAICDRAGDISREFAESTKANQVQQSVSKLPMSTLSDFVYLMSLAQRGLGAEAEDGEHAISQMQVIRAQIDRVASIHELDEDVAMDNVQKRNPRASPPAGVPSLQDAKSPIPKPSTTSVAPKSHGSYAGRSNKRQRREMVRSDDLSGGSSDEGAASPIQRGKSSVLPKCPTGEAISPGNKRGASSPSIKRKPLASFNSNGKSTAQQEQLILDLGQRLHLTCQACQMSYDRSDPTDVMLHTRHHDRVTRGVEWSRKLEGLGEVVGKGEIPLKDAERVFGKDTVKKAMGTESHSAGSSSSSSSSKKKQRAAAFDLDALLVAKPRKGASATVGYKIFKYSLSCAGTGAAMGTRTASESPNLTDPSLSSSLAEVLGVINEALGSAPLPPSLTHGTPTTSPAKMYVVSLLQHVVAAIVVGPIRPGSARLIARGHPLDEAEAEESGAVYTDLPPLPSHLTPPIGVHRVYTLPSLRRLGLARRLLDVALDSAIYGMTAAKVLDEFGSTPLLLLVQPDDQGQQRQSANESERQNQNQNQNQNQEQRESGKTTEGARSAGGSKKNRVVGFSQPSREGRLLAERWLFSPFSLDGDGLAAAAAISAAAGTSGNGGGVAGSGQDQNGQKVEEEEGWVVFEE